MMDIRMQKQKYEYKYSSQDIRSKEAEKPEWIK